MKKRLFLFVLLAVLLAAACKKDDPCDGITCVNGGTCANGSCNCPTGFEGSDCSLQTTPIRINITSVSVTDFPPTEPGGSSWDVSNGADLYVALYLNGDLVAENSASRILNVTDTPEGWSSMSTAFEMTETTNQYSLWLFDYDDFDADDPIGGIVFQPYSSTNGFPETIPIACVGCEVAFSITVDYDF